MSHNLLSGRYHHASVPHCEIESKHGFLFLSIKLPLYVPLLVRRAEHSYEKHIQLAPQVHEIANDQIRFHTISAIHTTIMDCVLPTLIK
jgi:hypothetical protein